MATQGYISPFRYPGGKSWFVPTFRRWLEGKKVKVLVEPFAGGASISLSCLEAGDCERVVLVERDLNVCAVWKTILGPESKRLSDRTRVFRASRVAVENELRHGPTDEFELAWQTLLKNRISHGGITAPGSGILKHGENGKGLSSRWYPETLAERIERIHALRARITFVEGDGVEYVSDVYEGRLWRRAAFFVDPPYPRAGRRLYNHGTLDHAKLFEMLSKLSQPFLATYERVAQIANLAAQYGLHSRTTGMRTRSHRTRRELLISNRSFYKGVA